MTCQTFRLCFISFLIVMATHFANELYFLPLYKPISFNNMPLFISILTSETSRIRLGWLSPEQQYATCTVSFQRDVMHR